MMLIGDQYWTVQTCFALIWQEEYSQCELQEIGMSPISSTFIFKWLVVVE